MTRIVRRAAVTLTLAAAAAVTAASPALASQAPGLPSSNASCVGAGLDFIAHYGFNGDSYPTVVHGQVGPSISQDATSDGSGGVGGFTSTLAQSHGAIWDCVP